MRKVWISRPKHGTSGGWPAYIVAHGQVQMQFVNCQLDAVIMLQCTRPGPYRTWASPFRLFGPVCVKFPGHWTTSWRPMNTGHAEGTQPKSPRKAATLLRLTAAQWLCDPVNDGWLDGVTDLASLFRDSSTIMFSTWRGNKETWKPWPRRSIGPPLSCVAIGRHMPQGLTYVCV